MAWDDQQPPWGQKKRPSSPEEMIASLLKKIKEAFEGGTGGGDDGGGGGGGAPRKAGRGIFGGMGKIALVILVIAAIYLVQASYYTIKPGERGVILRFGEYSKITEPGLHFKIPVMDQVIKVDIETIRKEEFGFRTRIPGQRTQYQKKGYETESLMLTSDRNVIDVEWIVQYKIQDPVNYLFKVRDVRQSVRDVSEMAMRRIVGNMDFDYILSNREILAGSTKDEVQNVLNRYESGVNIITVQLQDVNPPDKVKPAFNEVNEADQDKKRLVNEAEEAYNKLVPKARGQAKQRLEEARGYAIERVNIAKGDTSRFLAVLKEYQAAEEVTRQRLYLETMQQVLPMVTDIYVVDEEQRSILPFMDLTGGKKK